MSNSSLISATILSNNRTVRNHVIDTITIHHAAAAKVSAEAIGREFQKESRQASSNYGIGYDGEIALYVPEDYRAWTSGSRSNDQRAVTIEVANSTGSPTWQISEKSMNSLIALCADICKRNNIKQLLWKGDKTLIGKPELQNMTVHRWFAQTSCPGDYLYSKMGYIADEVNKILNKKEEKPMEQTVFNFNDLINNLTNEQAYKIIEKANKYASTLAPDKYAIESCKKGVMKGIFSDGNNDDLLDNPKSFLKRQELAVILDRLGLMK